MVHNMSKLMEECNNLAVLEQRWLIVFWRVEICNHSCCTGENLPIDFSSFREPKCGSMVILIWSWVKIEVEMTK